MEVLVGTRVVRGPDWAWRDQDGGEGHLGTVAEVQVPEQEEGEGKERDGRLAPCLVTVQWDCGNRCRYRCGIGGKYDLKGFDSGPAGVVHEGHVCNGCGMDPITGMLWKCVRCHEYCICTECYMTGKHILEHEFDRFVTARERVRVPARGHCKRKEVRGIFKFADVVPWCDWEQQEGTEAAENGGEVMRLCSKNNDNSRGFVEIQWTDSEQKTIHMVGHEGKVELKCTEPTSGGYYYPDHLPIFGAPLPGMDPSALSTGDLVRVELEPEVFRAVQEGHGGWNEVMLNVMGKIGTVVGISESGDLRVRYPENLIYILCPEAVVKVDLPKFKAGDLVRISGDMEKVQSLQHGHGDWSDGVLLLLGEVGRVNAVYSGGDVLVMVKGKSWVFNPLCLSHASEAKDHSNEDNSLAKWVKEDANENLMYGLQTMLKKGDGTAVVMATSLCEVGILREFLTRFPSTVDTVSNGRTALHCAAAAGLVEPMKVLLEFKANVEMQDDTSTRALHSSAYHGNEETTQLLVDAGADVNAQTLDGSTPAMFAVVHNNARVLKVLLKSPNIDLSIQDEAGNTALHAAVISQKLPCILPLLEAGADPVMLNFSLLTPLHYSARMGYIPVVEALLQHCPDSVKSKDGYCNTILHCAAFQDQLDVITLAISQRGCDIEAKNDYEQTPLHMAIARGNCKSIEKLIGYGASVNAVDQDGSSPLHYITTREIVEPPSEESPMILKLQRALFGKFMEDTTSVMYGIISVAALLIKKGADIHQTNNNGRSAYNFMPFIATLMTVLADYEEVIEEGGHPDGSPLLRLTNTDKLGRPSKQSRGSSSLMYQDGSEDGSHSEYYGGNSGGSEFVMFPGYDESHYKPRSKTPVTSSRTGSRQFNSSTTYAPRSSTSGGTSGYSSTRSGTGSTVGAKQSSTTSNRPTPPPRPANTSSAAHTTTAISSSTSTGRTKQELCFLCDNVVDVKFSPCGHAAMCGQCAPKAIRCPLCKVTVDGLYTVTCVNCHKRESEVRRNCGHGMCKVCDERCKTCAGCEQPD